MSIPFMKTSLSSILSIRADCKNGWFQVFTTDIFIADKAYLSIVSQSTHFLGFFKNKLSQILFVLLFPSLKGWVMFILTYLYTITSNMVMRGNGFMKKPCLLWARSSLKHNSWSYSNEINGEICNWRCSTCNYYSTIGSNNNNTPLL